MKKRNNPSDLSTSGGIDRHGQNDKKVKIKARANGTSKEATLIIK
jgi:hypothetical protein